MIQGELRQKLDIETVLSKISEYDIFMYYVPTKNWKLNEVFLSPFRQEKHGSFVIGNKRGYLSYIDFGDTKYRGDCFNFVQQLYNLPSLIDALEKIDFDFGLGIKSIQKDYKQIVTQYKQPEITKRNTLIQVITRRFTKEELQYWKEYHIDISELNSNNIYSIKTLYLNKQKFPLKDSELRFGYLYPKGGFWKIYRPTANKKNKWIGNVPLQTSWGEENLNKEQNALVCKSLKDYMVCKKIFPYVCGVQNESLEAFSESFVSTIKSKSKEVFYGGDSDKPGKQASYDITEIYGFNHINPEDRLLPEVKDFADWARIENLSAIEEHFKKKGVIS